MMESLGFIALCLAVGLILWNRWQTKRTMQRLDEMLTSAMNGNFTEKSLMKAACLPWKAV